ncbi:MAG: hypothetical protein WCY93_07580 [Anaerolineaceae bacterium]
MRQTFSEFTQDMIGRSGDLLWESPALVDDVDFNLGNEVKNKAKAVEFLKKQKEVFHDTPQTILFRTENDAAGNLVLINKTSGKVEYLVNFKRNNFGKHGQYVTQVKLWRDMNSVAAVDLTRKMFFGYLLPKYGTIMSDSLQTHWGKAFWITQMTRAAREGYQVGFADMNFKKVIWYDPQEQDLATWIAARDAWGRENKFQARRFLIRCK